MRTETLTFAGYFWLPKHPNERVPGTLMIVDGGKPSLEILGNFDRSSEDRNHSKPFPRIVGHVEGKGLVSLEYCTYKNRNLFGGEIARSTLFVGEAYLGVAFDEAEEIRLDRFQFSVEGLEAWHSISGLKSEFHPATNSSVITFQPPAPVVLWSGDGFTLSLSFGFKGPSIGSRVSSGITQTSYFLIKHTELRPLKDYRSIAYKVVNLMSLALDTIVSIRDVHVRTKATEEASEQPSTEAYAQLFFESIFWSASPPKIDPHDVLFSYGRFAPIAQSAFSAWLSMHETLLPAIGLYFSAQTEKHTFISGRFLALAQALEVYHRRTSPDAKIPDEDFIRLREILVNASPETHREFVKEVTNHWNEPALRTRLERLLGRFSKHFGSDDERATIAGEIVKLRNYYTHFNPRSKAKDVDGKNIWRLCTRMNALFQFCLLSDLGFSPETLDEIASNCWQLKQRLTWKSE